MQPGARQMNRDGWRENGTLGVQRRVLSNRRSCVNGFDVDTAAESVPVSFCSGDVDGIHASHREIVE